MNQIWSGKRVAQCLQGGGRVCRRFVVVGSKSQREVFPFFEIQTPPVRLVALVLMTGFPVVLVFSWAFEITPEGIKRES